ncbi:MAG: flagellar motor protein MotD [Thiohalospira sp.]|uniref:flagellar motor protein MotD n=1 Tax=Thiohalospira sp. TaxID=3080549 RepID=UPI00398118FF
MARKKPPEEPENLERWLVSYADFITLLFAFFVVMYSISQVNEGKYRILSDTLNSAFQTDARTMSPIQMGDPGMAANSPEMQQTNSIGRTTSAVDADQMASPAERAVAEMKENVDEEMEPLIDEGLLSVSEDKNFVEIEIDTSSLFESGGAKPTEAGVPILEAIGNILEPLPFPVKVEGHTDNRPIETDRYPSNWELSAARAASVVRLLASGGVESSRLSAVGYGEQRPVADNDTADGREENRRVVLILEKRPPREDLDEAAGDEPPQEGTVGQPSDSGDAPTGTEGSGVRFRTSDDSAGQQRQGE